MTSSRDKRRKRSRHACEECRIKTPRLAVLEGWALTTHLLRFLGTNCVLVPGKSCNPTYSISGFHLKSGKCVRHWPRELLGNPILKLGSSLLHCQFY